MRTAATTRSGGPRAGSRPLIALTAATALLLGACGDAGDPAATDGAATTAPGQATDDDDATATTPTADPGDDATSTEDDMDARHTRIPVPAPGTVLPTGPVPESIVQRDEVQAAIAAEAERTGVEVGQVQVVGYAQVTWSDGSLGCPKPGMIYTQALVPGQQLILAVDGQPASYHASMDGAFSYCASPVAPTGQGAATDR